MYFDIARAAILVKNELHRIQRVINTYLTDFKKTEGKLSHGKSSFFILPFTDQNIIFLF